MKRLFTFATIILLSMTVLMPLLEYFDRWDRPGLGSDTELPLFLITLFITLVILVAAALARHRFAQQTAQTETAISCEFVRSESRCWVDIVVSPTTSPPLRI